MVQGTFFGFTDDAQLGEKHIMVLEEEKSEFLYKVYRPYFQSVIDHINVRMESTELISAMSVFDPRHPCVEQRIKVGGDEGISQPDIEAKETESEWKLFRRLIFLQYKGRSLQFILSRLLGNGEIYAAFPNLAKIAAILEVLPVTTATVEGVSAIRNY
ncbi:hypothetical protein LOD99_13735 [Oopsacas minuta]|uniref:Uncharacterized protein n=1 Tax=Oopsacas minuta TaxID=111878 RepID=A0AAV7KI23_9METZ|nr:hypothetical protein LOD99_13735 [Oopsacas minuta]